MDGFPKSNHAFGVDPRRPEFYSLRQARYDALADDIDALAAKAALDGRTLKVIDVGCSDGTLLRHLEPRPHFDAIEFHGADFKPHALYRPERYASYVIDDLMAGNPKSASNAFDVVSCEQVLEHIADISKAIPALERIAKPGGLVSIGVPIFPPPLAAARRAYVQASLKLRPTKTWSHIQTFSLRSILRQVRTTTHLQLVEARGFRVVSGGILRTLENRRDWYDFNRRLGRAAPWACVEAQALFLKPAERPRSRDAGDAAS